LQYIYKMCKKVRAVAEKYVPLHAITATITRNEAI
jgi:hypothetical protein